jgi:hypothetical protein
MPARLETVPGSDRVDVRTAQPREVRQGHLHQVRTDLAVKQILGGKEVLARNQFFLLSSFQAD